MELRQFVTTLVDTLWERERHTHHSADAAVLGYVRDGVAAELEYRRRIRELDRRIAFLDEPAGVASDR